MVEFHPELRRAARLIPRHTVSPAFVRVARILQRLSGLRRPRPVPGVTIRDAIVPVAGNRSLRVRLYIPDIPAASRPAMLWLHGGGFLFGRPEQDEASNIDLCRELGMVIAAAAYRLAPEHPFPAPLDDAYAALTWLHAQAADLGIAKERIAIGGASAGGGLAAGLVLHAHDRGEVPIAFQLLIYPMLDDRTTLRTDIDETPLRLWNCKSNRFGWTSYLGDEPGGGNVPSYAAPARRVQLEGLPPAWIGIGTCDLFHDENLEYARRLGEAGVPCTLKVVEGAFHGFDVISAKAPVVAEFRRSLKNTMRDCLCRV